MSVQQPWRAAEAPENESGWLTRERVLALILLVATGLVFYLCYLLIYPFLTALAWALALAVIALPLYRRIKQWVSSDNVAAGVAVLVIAVILVAPAILLTSYTVLDAGQSFPAAETFESDAENWSAALDRSPRLGSAVAWIKQRVDLGSELKRLAGEIGGKIPGFVTGSIGAVIQLLVTFFALFYFLRDRHAVLHFLRASLPLSRDETERVFDRVAVTIRATVFGSLLVAVVQGALGGLMFYWMDLPAPALWGAAMALLALIPVLGAFVIWMPAAVWLAMAGHWEKALVLALWGAVVIGLIDNLLYPVFVGSKLRMHTLPVFFAIVGGLVAFGISGLILGPVVLAVSVALIDVWRYRTAGGRTADGDVPP
jgi:predicted PurR-regulated permease PerM